MAALRRAWWKTRRMLATMGSRRATSGDEYPVVPPPTLRLSGRVLGIDVGGTGIKAAVVDVASGQLVTDRQPELVPHTGFATGGCWRVL
jgi:hexokinase